MIETFADHVRSHAEGVLPKDGGMRPFMGLWKDKNVYAWIFPPNELEDCEPEEILARVAWATIVGCEPDAISLAHDQYFVKTPLKPDGSYWARGEMSKAKSEGGELGKLVSECIQAMVFDRLGNMTSVTCEYEIEDGTVEWKETTTAEDGVDGFDAQKEFGVLIKVIKEAFKMPTIRDTIRDLAETEKDLEDVLWATQVALEGEKPGFNAQMAVEMIEENPEKAFASIVIACFRAALLPMGCSMLICSKDKEAQEVFKDFTERSDEISSRNITDDPMHGDSHPLSGKSVIVHPLKEIEDLKNGAVFKVDDWVDLLDLRNDDGDSMSTISWKDLAASGHLPSIFYKLRVNECEGLPEDNQIVYGSINRGEIEVPFIVHTIELGEEVSEEPR